MNEWQILMAVEARYKARVRCRSRPAWRRFWRRWSSFGLRLWRCWGRVEMVAVLKVVEGVIAKAREVVGMISINLAEILDS